MAKPPAKKTASSKARSSVSNTIGAKGKKRTSAAAKKAAAALKSATVKKAAMRKKTVTPAKSKRSVTTAAGAPRKKPGPKPGSKRSILTAAGKPRRKPGPKPTIKTPANKPAIKKTASRKTAAKAPARKKTVARKPALKKVVVEKSIAQKSAAKTKSNPKAAKPIVNKTTTTVRATKKKAQTNPVAKRKAVPSVQKPSVKAAQKRPKAKTTTLKPIAKTVSAKKASLKTLKPSPKARTAKKPQIKKAISKKPALVKAAIKPSTAKPKASATPAPARKHLKTRPVQQTASLKARIDNIQSRLERSEAQTHKNVLTLKKAFRTLQAKVGTETPDVAAQVAVLSRRIEAISTSAQADVNAALNEALNNPTSNNLTDALTRAEARLADAENAQSASISKVNRHIADMAIAIDARFKKEALASKHAINTLDKRITNVEKESAAAISHIGEKVIAISSEFVQRAHNSEEIIKEKVSELALKTQQDFEHYRANLETRIEAFAEAQTQARSGLDVAIRGLSSRLEGLEHFAGSPGAALSTETLSEEIHETRTNFAPVPAPTPLRLVEDNDAFSPNTAHDAFGQGVPPNPYAAPEISQHTSVKADINMAPAHIPQEYTPVASSQSSFDAHALENAQIPAPQTLPVPTPVPAPIPTPVPAAAPLPSADIPELTLPYADPAYAETSTTHFDEAMSQARPGGFGEEKKRLTLPKLNISPRNLKLAGVALGVMVIGIVGVKALGGNSDANTLQADNGISRNLDSAMNGSQTITMPSNNDPMVIETTAPTIGNYADNTVNVAPAGSAQALTLEAAAKSGDPVAQYQMGVSYLENGRIDEAVKLIRSASDNGQPAAQYRLAKLYETGEGVTQNADMARQLTERAARSGNRIAMHDLALYHAEGRGGIQMNLDSAAKWFEKAAERGVVDSQFNLGVMYETGKGVPKNLTDALVWYSVAAAQGDQLAKERVGVLETQLDGTLITAAQTRARKFTPSKIDQGANGIFNNLSWTTQQKDAQTQTGADPRVKDVQVMLTGLGFDTGGVDGSIGPKTRTAIVSFQKANGLSETGQVDETLIDRLEFASGA